MENHQVETEFQQKYGNTGELTCPTDCTNGSSKYGRKANIVTIYKKGDRTKCGNYRQDLCSEATEQTLKPHYPIGGPRDTVQLLFKPKHSRHDLLPTTTPGKVHRAGSTSVYCLCRLHKVFDIVGRTGLWQLLRK